ncbi:WXG100 family type VII secretion target [Nocardioides plantarum]|uniref:WXG100 family type VII secretion target n=1 Tax=Nocardioides plantarum TaxID=29299 RepID=A0ABV5KA96_9ACTN|nr:WXG100 family type VII secretion target [Nocardioides plantarum]
MTLDLVHADLISTVAELRDVASALDAERRRTDLAVDVLLDGGWSGRAASAYREGWEEWRAGCGRVLAALSSMAELISTCHADQVEQDELAAAGLRTLTAELLSTGARS